jgi:hypothetical protein
MLTSIFRWQNNDSTLDLNDRFRRIFRRGVLSGGMIAPVPAQLKITLSPFHAMSYEGMMVAEPVAPTLTIPLNQTSIISVYAKYNLGAAPTLEYAVTEASVFNALPDKAYHIVFGTVTVNSPATFVTIANISYALREEVDNLGRSPFRGQIPTTSYLPLDNPAGTNKPGDYFVINQGLGDLPTFYAWDGVTWQNVTNTLSLAADLTAHRNNLFPNEIHLSDDQADAALGSSGLPSAINRYVTELDPRLPTQNENDALQGDYGSPSNTNRYVTEEYPISSPEIISYPLPPGGAIELSTLNGPFYVGKDGVGTANKYFALMDFTSFRGYVNSVYTAPSITGVFVDVLLTTALDPSTDINVDSDGFYSGGNLYLQVSTVVDTSFRVSYGRKRQLKTIGRSFSVANNPGDEYVPSQVVEKLSNIKGRIFTDPVPTREQNINLRKSIDSISSYLGSVLETNVVAANEDYTRLKDEAVIGSYFVKNTGITPIYTFQNTGLIGFTYNNVLGRVTYNTSVGLSNVVVGNIFIDGLNREFKVAAVNDGADTIDILSLDTGTIPSSISTSVGTSTNGSIKKNNNPRNLLVSEFKVSHEVERFPVYGVYQKQDEFSKPDGRVAYAIKNSDGRPEPRIVFYGSFENYENQYREKYVRCAGTGKIYFTGFFSGISLLLRRRANGPDLVVSVNEESSTTISTSYDGLKQINSTVADYRGERYQKFIISSGHDQTILTTVSAEILNPTAEPLEIYGVEFIRSTNSTQSFLESGRAFENAELVKLDTPISNIPIPYESTAGRGSRTLVYAQEGGYGLGNIALTDLDGSTPPSGTSTGMAITGVTSSKLVGYKAGDIISIEQTFFPYFPYVVVMRKIVSIVGTTINLDSNSGIAGSVSIYHVCSLDSSVPNNEEEEVIRYFLPKDFINYTSTDLEVPGPINRYVLHKDGHTLLAGENLEVVSTGISGSPKALRINSTGNLKFVAVCTRFDIVTNNTAACTVDIKIDGSPAYSFSFAGNGAQRRTIFLNSRYQSHEIQISPTLGDLAISEIILFGPNKPSLTGFPNVLADISVLATYRPSSPYYLLAPEVYPYGSVYYDAFHYLTYLNGTGVNPDWSISNNFSKTPYGRYVVTENEESEANFTFYGSAFELSYVTGPDHGQFKVEVDGVDLSILPGVTIVGDYSFGYVDAYSASYGRRNIGAHAASGFFPFGMHTVRVYVDNPRGKNGLSTGYKMGFVGFYVGNWEFNLNGPVSFALNRNGVYSSFVDTRNFVPLPPEKALVEIEKESPESLVRAQRLTTSLGDTSLSATFSSPLPDTNYVLSVNWINLVDSSPLFQPIIIDSYNELGFTIRWNYPLDTSNYQIIYTTTGIQ